MTTGNWIERLEAIAAGRELVAVAGRRDAAGAADGGAATPATHIHVFEASLLEGKGKSRSIEAGGAVAALAFAGGELLLSGGEDGALVAWDVGGGRAAIDRAAALALGAPIRAIALDEGAARGDAGTIAVGTADGALALVQLAIVDGRTRLLAGERHALSDGPIAAVCWDAAGLWLAGGLDGQLRVIGEAGIRAIAPGGDGGIRAVGSVGDGRAVIGCGDGSIRTCFVVGEVEPVNRSGDHGHGAAVRALVLAPVVADDAGKELPRRLFSAGDDGVLKEWAVDGTRRPQSHDLELGPLTALALAPGPVARVDQAVGRLWTCSTDRKVAADVVGPDLELTGEPQPIGSLLDAYEERLRDPRAASKVKLEIVAQLAAIPEDEARVLLDLALESGPPDVRIAATGAMVAGGRRASRPA
ncbi:MAG TPA: hypothetical protein VK932_20145, partial [Kofleriaceae bacterium]|nr:hypothetical protein [Kofleriaceae bacterium]